MKAKKFFKKSKLFAGMALAAGVAFGSIATTMALTENNVEAATVKNKWVYDSKTKTHKYYGSDGKAYKGWHWMTSKEGEKKAHWSYFGNDGVLRTGWQTMGKGTSNPDGNNKKHVSYFGANGWLRTGWVQLGKGTSEPDGNKAKHWSYFGPDGWLRTGWQEMGKGTSNPDGNNKKHISYFGANGWLREGWVQLGKGTSEPDGNKAKHWSYFGPNGWLRTGWQEMGKGTSNPDGNNNKHKSYFGDNGWLVTGTSKIGGKTYEFNSLGWLVKEVTTTTTTNSTAGWKSGVASAYGGSTDPGCGSITANGSRVTESSMGVAIPLAWGRRDLLGHKVMISYGGKTVTATINDLGGMGGGSRALDLQPGVWRAFGFNSCNSWGIRTVKYKIL